MLLIMQAKSEENLAVLQETENVSVGRKLTRHRPAQGARLADFRKAAELSQYELARLLSVSQANIAFWELSDKPPRSEVLLKMAEVLGVTVEALLSGRPVRKGGPVGKVRKLFEEVSHLPRNQQDKVVEFVSAFVSQAKQNGAHAK